MNGKSEPNLFNWKEYCIGQRCQSLSLSIGLIGQTSEIFLDLFLIPVNIATSAHEPKDSPRSCLVNWPIRSQYPIFHLLLQGTKQRNPPPITFPKRYYIAFIPIYFYRATRLASDPVIPSSNHNYILLVTKLPSPFNKTFFR